MMRSCRIKLALALLGLCLLSACYYGDVGVTWGETMGYPAPYGGYGGYPGYGGVGLSGPYGGYYGGYYGGGAFISLYGHP